MEFLDFRVISQVPFKAFLDWLQIPYEETQRGELKGKLGDDSFIVSVEKNLYFSPNDNGSKGSVINFLSNLEGISLREAAGRIKQNFLQEPTDPIRDIPELTLTYHPYLADNGISEEQAAIYECGYCSRRSIMAGKIAFKICDITGAKVGYLGINPKDGKWFFPKGFKRHHIYGLHRLKGQQEIILTLSPMEAIIHSGISILGASLTEEQGALLAEHVQRVKLIHYTNPQIIQQIAKYCFVKVIHT